MSRNLVPENPSEVKVLEGTTLENRHKLLAAGWEPLTLYGKAPVSPEWRTTTIDAAFVDTAEDYWRNRAHTGNKRREAEGKPTKYLQHPSTGIRCGHVVGGDIDLHNKDHTKLLGNGCRKTLGRSDLVRYGKKGVLLVYYAPEPFQRVRLMGVAPDGPRAGEFCTLIEFLADGQQFAANGWHEDSTDEAPIMYRWPSKSPLDCRPEDLPHVTKDKVVEYLQQAKTTLAGLGYTNLVIQDAARDFSESYGSKGPSGEGKCEAWTTAEIVTNAAKAIRGCEVTCDVSGETVWRDGSLGRRGWLAVIAGIANANVRDPEDPSKPDENFDKLALCKQLSRGEFHESMSGNFLDDAEVERAYHDMCEGRSNGATYWSLLHIANDPRNGYGGPRALDKMASARTGKPVFEGGSGIAPDDASVSRDDDSLDSDHEEDNKPNRWASLYRSAEDIRTNKPPVPIIPGLLLSTGITAALAPRRTGKTIVVLDLALHIAAHFERWCGLPIYGDWAVVYLCGEDHDNAMAHVQGWCDTYNDGEVPADFIWYSDVPNLLAGDNLDVAALIEDAKARLPGKRIVWIVDTVGRATSKTGENDQERMREAMDNLEALYKQMRGPVVGCFHPPKSNPGTIGGTGYQENVASAIWHIEREDAKDPANPFRVLTVDNIKGPGEGEKWTFKFEPVDVGEPDEQTGHQGVGVVARPQTYDHMQKRAQERQTAFATACDALMVLVADQLNQGKRVLMANSKLSSAVQLSDLAEMMADHLPADEKDREKSGRVKQMLMRLTDTRDGRLRYQERDGSKPATLILTDKGRVWLKTLREADSSAE